MRNHPTTETELWEQVRERLSKAVPWDWVFESPRPRGAAWPGDSADPRVDAWLKLRIQGVEVRVAVELRLRFEPRDVEGLRDLAVPIQSPSRKSDRVGEAKNKVAGWLLATPFLSRRSQELLATAGWSYADATGNIRIVLDQPPAFVQLQGAAKGPSGEPRPLRSLKGPAAGRLVRALADFRPPYGVLDLADRAGVSAAMASRVVALLEADAIITRTKRGAVTGVDWKALLERWSEEYNFTRSNRVMRYLALRGLKPMLESLRKSGCEYAITGTLLAERRRSVASSVAAYIYTTDSSGLASELELESTPRASNVLLVEPFDRVVFERSWIEEGLRYVALSQAVADLLTSGDRNPQIAGALMDWMQENESAWRD
jgi:hypothetical protein